MPAKTKTIKFTIEFEKPPKEAVIALFACPVCKVERGMKCHTQIYGHVNQAGGNPMSDLHHDRYALWLNLEVVHSSTLYRIAK